ncbi:MAG: hypothetical protein ACT6RN_24695 [Agrobacterium sp.]|uniref:hypothetical protein n=1 Tax=Agrobacterium sp. TaxID=361 RepID=UPI004037CD04
MRVSRRTGRDRQAQMFVPGPIEIPVAVSQPVEQQAACRIAALGNCTQPQHQRLRHKAVQRTTLPDEGERQPDQNGGVVAIARTVIQVIGLERRDIREPAVKAGRRDAIGRDRFATEAGHRRAVGIDGHDCLLAGAHRIRRSWNGKDWRSRPRNSGAAAISTAKLAARQCRGGRRAKPTRMRAGSGSSS